MISLALVDTNVVVSGLLAAGNSSPNGRILDAMLAGTLRFVLSPALLAEYRRVMLRPAIVARHRLSAEDVDQVLEFLVLNAWYQETEDGAAACAEERGGTEVPETSTSWLCCGRSLRRCWSRETGACARSWPCGARS